MKVSENTEAATRQAIVDQHYKALKAKLKLRSKTQLIDIIWDQGVRYSELQNAAQELLAQLKELQPPTEPLNENAEVPG